jgi:effector-binding domain-containing protein
MSYEVQLATTLPRPLAAIRRTVKQAELPNLIRGVLGEVWQFLRDNRIRSTGHNVTLYLAAHGQGADLSLDTWFGVEVHEVIPASELVVATSTPAGPVATTVHWGPYSELGGAHEAVLSWCRTNGRHLAGPSWEVYGDWFDDWAKVRTDVFYALEP